MTPQRKQEINDSTPQNPVRLTSEEVAAFHEDQPKWLQHSVGTGRFIVPAVEGSPADKARKLKDKGLSNAAIAAELGLAESSVRTILDRSL